MFTVGNREYKDPPARCGTNDMIIMGTVSKSNKYKTCYMCKYHALPKLSSSKCASCLLTDELDNFVLDDYTPEELKELYEKNQR